MASIKAMNAPPTPRVELLRSAPLNSWIALSKDETRIVATGKTLMETDEAARKSGEQDYLLTKIPDAWLPRVLHTIAL